MHRRLSILVLSGLLGAASWAQAPAETSTKQQSEQSTAQQQQGSQAQETQAAPGTESSAAPDQKPTSDQEKPGAMQRLKKHLKDQMSSGCVNAIGQHCWDKPPKDSQTGESSEEAQQPPASQPLPRSSDSSKSEQTGESSSRGTKVDLSPPPGEAPAPGVGGAGDVQEMKPWDPHKADKNVEIGDFYFKQKNYRAAESRYAEALYWQDNDAIAMFRLAEAEEKLGKVADARKNYAGYLKILPDGEFSAKAKEGLERLKNKPDGQEKAEVRSKK